MGHDFKIGDRVEFALDGKFDDYRKSKNPNLYDLGTVVGDGTYFDVKWDSDGEITSPNSDYVRKLPTQSKVRPHAELIKAWADGAEIQCFRDGNWYDVDNPDWASSTQYRIKPNEIKLVAFIDEHSLRWVREELFASISGSCIRVPSEDKIVTIKVANK